MGWHCSADDLPPAARPETLVVRVKEPPSVGPGRGF